MQKGKADEGSFQVSLLDYKNNTNSQNGEDGIISEIMRRIGRKEGVCCEFGAWDGVHLSNTRQLIEDGWEGVLVECNKRRFKKLLKNYRDIPNVHCINSKIDHESNSISKLLSEIGLHKVDFLSIDIDGDDYLMLVNLNIRPEVISIEVNNGHDPESRERIPYDIATKNVGQPLGLFFDVANKLGYDLVALTGNAFFVRRDILPENIPVLNPSTAYDDFLNHLEKKDKIWLYLVNKGYVNPFYSFNNPKITKDNLGLGRLDSIKGAFFIMIGMIGTAKARITNRMN